MKTFIAGMTFLVSLAASPALAQQSSLRDKLDEKWEIALESGTILKPSTLAQMAVPVKLKNDSIVQESDGTRHGLGWDLPTWQGHRVMAHGGDHVTGFTANFARLIDDKVAVIILTNVMPLDIGSITKRVAGYYVPTLTISEVSQCIGCAGSR